MSDNTQNSNSNTDEDVSNENALIQAAQLEIKVNDEQYMYCDSLDSGDVIIEEVVEASTEKQGCCPKISDQDDVILIADDNDDENLTDYTSHARKKARGSCDSSMRSIVPKHNRWQSSNYYETTSQSSDALEIADDCVPSLPDYFPNRPVIDGFLSEIGLKIVLCRVLSSVENDPLHMTEDFNLNNNSVSHLHLPQRFCKCGFKTDSALVFNSHVNLESNLLPLKCCLCGGFSTKRIKQLAEHMKKDHKVPDSWVIKQLPYQCTFCPFDTNSSASLKRHLRICSARFSLNTNLAPRLDDGKVQNFMLQSSSELAGPVSVIYQNPRNQTFSQDFISMDVGSLRNQQSVIVSNSFKQNSLQSVKNPMGGCDDFIGSNYYKGSLNDVQSLIARTNIVHKIDDPLLNDFNSYSSLSSENTTTIGKCKSGTTDLEEPQVLDEVSKSEQTTGTGGDKTQPSRVENFMDVEMELAKMTLRRECVWCSEKFSSLSSFEAHVAKIHDDLNCTIEGFWTIIEPSLSNCAGQKIAATKTCSYCSRSFKNSSSCHRHLINNHWDIHLKTCSWCQKVCGHPSPYTFKLHPEDTVINLDDSNSDSCGGLDGCRTDGGTDLDDGDSTSSFLSDIDGRS